MIVDDMPSIRSIEKAVIQELGIVKIAEAADGREAMRLLNLRQFDLIVCDWDMPEMTGIELLREVRKTPELTTIPFMMVTAVSDVDQVREAIKEGVTDYIAKPFQQRCLSDKVRKSLTDS